jgi:hypothetical protein
VADRRSLDRLLAGGLSGKEVARLVLRNHADDLAGREPTFSDAEVGRAKAGLRGRSREAAVYDAWVEAARIVDHVTMDALAKALEAEGVLRVLILSVVHLFRLGALRSAVEAGTKVLTPEEWATFPARREAARRATMVRERVSLGEAVRARAWRLAPEGLRTKLQIRPDYDDDDGDGYDLLLEVNEPAARRLRAAAEAELAGLARTGRLRFVWDGEDVSAAVGADWRESMGDTEAEALEEGAECGLLELVEAGLPEWEEHAEAERLTPPEFRGPVAVLQEIQPARLGEGSRPVDPVSVLLEAGLRHESGPESLERLRSMAGAAEVLIRAFLARKSVVEVLGQEIGVDLFASVLREREETLRGLLAGYGPLAAMSREGGPDGDGSVPPERALPLPRELRLPPMQLEELGPDQGDVERLRAVLAVPDARAWWEAAEELGVVGAQRDADAELKGRLRRRGRELGSFNMAASELVAEQTGSR